MGKLANHPKAPNMSDHCECREQFLSVTSHPTLVWEDEFSVRIAAWPKIGFQKLFCTFDTETLQKQSTDESKQMDCHKWNVNNDVWKLNKKHLKAFVFTKKIVMNGCIWNFSCTFCNWIDHWMHCFSHHICVVLDCSFCVVLDCPRKWNKKMWLSKRSSLKPACLL